VRTLVVGASGFVGTHLMWTLGRRDDALGTSFSSKGASPSMNDLWELDVRAPDAVSGLVADFHPEVVIHLAAISNIDWVSENESAAREVNVDGTRNVVSACEGVGARIVLLSTDYVFDGADGPYDEESLPNPVNAYGRMKLEAELEVLDSLLPHLVVRTSLVYGWPEPKQHPNFVSSAIERLRSGRGLDARADAVRTPVYVGDLVDLIVALVETDSQGVVNVASSDASTMFEFALAVCDEFKLDRSKVRSAGGPQNLEKAQRPLCCGLRTRRVSALLGRSPHDTRMGLSRMKREESNMRGCNK